MNDTTTPQEWRDETVGELSDARHNYDSARINRVRAIARAKRRGLTLSEIAAVVGLSESTVRFHIKNAGDFD